MIKVAGRESPKKKPTENTEKGELVGWENVGWFGLTLGRLVGWEHVGCSWLSLKKQW